MTVKYKIIHKDAKLQRANPTDAGVDLFATSCSLTSEQEDNNRQYSYIEYGTGICVEIPEGHVGLLFPRSSISNYDLALTNSVGVIDAGYRGEVRARFKLTAEAMRKLRVKSDVKISDLNLYKVGDKICQLVIIPILIPEFELSIALSDSDRGTGGYGSSGK